MTVPAVLTNTVSRILYGAPLVIFGLLHFMNAQGMSGLVPSYFPAPIFWVYLTGAALILAGGAIIANRKAKLASVLLGIMLLIFALTIHLASFLGGNQASLAQFLKDTALAGAAFALAGILED